MELSDQQKNSKNRRKYNACYRLRKKQIKIDTRAKTIYGNAYDIENPEYRILIKEYHYVLQTQMFSVEEPSS